MLDFYKQIRDYKKVDFFLVKVKNMRISFFKFVSIFYIISSFVGSSQSSQEVLQNEEQGKRFHKVIPLSKFLNINCNNLNGLQLSQIDKDDFHAQGLKLFGNVRYHLNNLHFFKKLQYLDLSNSDVCDQSSQINNIQEIENIKTLTAINFSGLFIDDNIFSKLSNLENLKALNLSKTSVTGHQLPQLKGKIEWLDLSYTLFSDEVVKSLPVTLEYINVDGSLVDKEEYFYK